MAKTRKVRNVGVVIDLDWPYKRHHEVFAGIHHYATTHSKWRINLDLYAGQTLKSRRLSYDGIIGRITSQTAGTAGSADISMVNVWISSPARDVPTVVPDVKAAGRMAAKHLLAKGFVNFGFLGFKQHSANAIELEGFQSTLSEKGFSCTSLMVPASYTSDPKKWQRFITKLDEWIDTWPLPMGILASYDLLGRYLICACERKDLSIPKHVAVVGSNNEPVICSHPEPSLTSIDLGYEKVGYHAAKLLDKLMRGGNPPAEPLLIQPAALMPRHSTDLQVVEDRTIAAALRFISDNIHNRISVDDVAQSVEANRRTLERQFRTVLNQSIAGEITRLRVERVKRLLVENDMTIKHIASNSGFRDGMQLGVVFKRVTGLSPTAYRKKHRRNR